MTYLYAVIAGLVAAIAAFTDYRSGRIPNWLTIGAIVLAVGLHITRGAFLTGMHGALSGGLLSLAGGLACAILPLFLYRKAGMGGGDLKLLVAIGALCGPAVGLQIQFYAFVVVLLYALGKLAFQGKLLGTLRNCLMLLTNPFRAKERRFTMATELRTSIRFGPSVFVAIVLIFFAHHLHVSS